MLRPPLEALSLLYEVLVAIVYAYDIGLCVGEHSLSNVWLHPQLR
ncbi:MAG TPA: hypothetical protein VFA39_20185 [Steroidobacteraceae bacterium]|nr:hypothetical protein [Steroidobacteraceae bacterium]